MIFTTVDVNMFGLIANCVCAKEAWKTLQKHCKGSESVRLTKVRMLISKFENLRMEESESITDYDRRLRDISNEAFSLGDPISNERLVSKVLRTLPERFNIKVCAIEEAKDTSTISLDDWTSSLRTFEMNMDLQKKVKGKTISLQVSDDSYNDLLQISHEVNELDLGEDSMALITKTFGDYLKRLRDKKNSMQAPQPLRITGPEKAPRFTQNQGQFRFKNEGKSGFDSKKYDSVQCRECNGYGHYANECANRLRKNKYECISER